MSRRLGLRAKMTASYVLVSALAVLLVEVVALALFPPGAAHQEDRTSRVFLTAAAYADRVARLSATLGRLPTQRELPLGETGLPLLPGQAEVAGNGVRIPLTPQRLDDTAPMSLALLLTPDRRVAASSYPARYPAGEPVDGQQTGPLPAELRSKRLPALLKGGRVSATARGDVVWAVAPVASTRGAISGAEAAPSGRAPAALVYVQVPAKGEVKGAAVGNLVTQLGLDWLAVLGLAVPVGLVFGLLSTRRLIGRLRRLARATVAVADGEFHHHLPASGGDEVAQLERNFNRMAERLGTAMAAERQLAGAAERARIARELHDAISQDLFSLHMLAGGLRHALLADSPLRRQVETMEATAAGTMQEMQALLLELRPVVLEQAGLIPALQEVCQSYRARLGVVVDAELEPVEVSPQAEHGVLRVVQEALANAVRHGRPTRIRLRVRGADGDRVCVEVSDDGGGFDPARTEQRQGMGLRSMRERVEELGGTFQLDSTPGAGTEVRILLPAGRP